MRRKPEYLSPSALGCFKNDPSEYYIRYIAETKSARSPQTRPMSVGSAFDAYIKNFLHTRIFGKSHPESHKYELEALLTSQVEWHNLEWARINGKYVFDWYVKCGAAADLMLDLEKAVDEPRFEFDLKGVINGHKEGITKYDLGVPLLGKPDLRYINSSAAHVITDFKVNGYCSASPISPMPGYCKVRDAFDLVLNNPSRGGNVHKDCIFGQVDGVTINVGAYLESYNSDWAAQLSTYGWLMGEPVGKEIINAIEQIVAFKPANSKGNKGNSYPLLRVASHRIRTSEAFQFQLLADYQELWHIVTSEPFYFFRDRSFEESEKKCEMIDRRIAQLREIPEGSNEDWLVKSALGTQQW